MNHKIHKIAQGILIMGCLIMATAKDYKGGELYSSQTFKYGKFEARMLMPRGSGVVSSMFLYYNDSYLGAPEPWREIDMEVLGKDPSQFQSNIITGNAAQRVTSEGHHEVPGGAHLGYHTYGMEWTPDFVRWTVDGVEVRKTTGQQVTDLRDKNQNLRFNLWAANIPSWVGPWEDVILPVYQYISWVKVWNHTPGAGQNGTDYTLAWTEEFQSWDPSRWGVANWTFAENRADFAPENVLVKDGILVLCLTKAPNLGHTGTVPPDNGSVVPTKHMKSREPLRLQRSDLGIQVDLDQQSTQSLQVLDTHGTQLASIKPTLSHNGTQWFVSKDQFSAGVHWIHIPGHGTMKVVQGI